MGKTLVDIIMPVYNTVKYLIPAITGVLTQSITDYELLLIDDGSSDMSGAMCDSFALSDSRVCAFHKKNGGQAQARNIGIDYAQADYLTFVDSDDIIHQDYLKALYSMIESNRSDISVCGIKSFLENESVSFNLSSEEGIVREMDSDEALCALLCQTPFDTEPCAKMFGRALFENVRFPEGFYTEDLGMIYKLFLNAKHVSYTANQYYGYLQRTNSTMHSVSNTKRFRDSYVIIDVLYNDILKYRPELINAAKSRAISVYFQSFAGAESCGDTELAESCWKKIRELRLSVLLDSKARKKARIASAVSFLGKGFLLFVYCHKH